MGILDRFRQQRGRQDGYRGGEEGLDDEEQAGLLAPVPTQQPDQPRRAALWVWLLLVAAVIAVASAGAAFDKMPDVPPLTLAAWRLQLTAIFLLPGCIWQLRIMSTEQRLRSLRSWWMLTVSGTCLGTHFGLWVWGLQHTSLAHALLLVCSTPVILVAWALIRRQPISLFEILGTLLAVVGALILALSSSAGHEKDVHLSGDVASFIAAILAVGYFLIGAHLRKWMPIFVYACPVTGVGALLLTVAGVIKDGPHWLFAWMSNRHYAPWVIYLAIGPGLVGHTGLNTVLAHLSTLTIGLAISMEPLVGSLIGWAIGVAGPPGPSTLGGGGMVLAAVVIVTLASNRREAAAAALAAAEKRAGHSTLLAKGSAKELGGGGVDAVDESEVGLLSQGGGGSADMAVQMVNLDNAFASHTEQDIVSAEIAAIGLDVIPDERPAFDVDFMLPLVGTSSHTHEV